LPLPWGEVAPKVTERGNIKVGKGPTGKIEMFMAITM
jgi:hypothetical protein